MVREWPGSWSRTALPIDATLRCAWSAAAKKRFAQMYPEIAAECRTTVGGPRHGPDQGEVPHRVRGVLRPCAARAQEGAVMALTTLTERVQQRAANVAGPEDFRHDRGEGVNETTAGTDTTSSSGGLTSRPRCRSTSAWTCSRQRSARSRQRCGRAPGGPGACKTAASPVVCLRSQVSTNTIACRKSSPASSPRRVDGQRSPARSVPGSADRPVSSRCWKSGSCRVPDATSSSTFCNLGLSRATVCLSRHLMCVTGHWIERGASK